MTYHPSSFQVSEFYLSVTRKYCFPTSFDDFLWLSMTIYVLIVLALAGAEAPGQAFAGRAGRPWPPDLVVFNVCCGFALCIHCVNWCKLHILHLRSLQSKICIFIVYIIFHCHCHWAALCCTSTPCRWFILGIRRCGEIVVQFIPIRFIWLAWCAVWAFKFLSQNWICIESV